MSQENLQTIIMQNFWGVKEVYYGIVQVVNTLQAMCWKTVSVLLGLFKGVGMCITPMVVLRPHARCAKLMVEFSDSWVLAT